jgi:hypothetical protein
LSQISPVHASLISLLEKIHFNIIIPPMLNGNRWYENVELLKYFLFEKCETTEERVT